MNVCTTRMLLKHNGLATDGRMHTTHWVAKPKRMSNRAITKSRTFEPYYVSESAVKPPQRSALTPTAVTINGICDLIGVTDFGTTGCDIPPKFHRTSCFDSAKMKDSRRRESTTSKKMRLISISRLLKNTNMLTHFQFGELEATSTWEKISSRTNIFMNRSIYFKTHMHALPPPMKVIL